MVSDLTTASSSEEITQRGVPTIGDPGRAGRELRAGAAPAVARAADHVLSEHDAPGVEIRAASVRGLRHRSNGGPRQDSFSVRQADGTTIVVVCDGVGSLPRSQEAADLVAGRLPDAYLAEGDNGGDLHRHRWENAVWAVNAELATRSGWIDGRPTATAAPMATTVVALALSGQDGRWAADVAWTDDSTVWHLSSDGTWTLITPIGRDQDSDVPSTGVHGLPSISPVVRQDTVELSSGALFVMTDGVSVPLAAAEEVRATLADWWATPPDVFTFARQVGFARKAHLDDRTVVGLWLKDGTPGAVPS